MNDRERGSVINHLLFVAMEMFLWEASPTPMSLNYRST